MLGAGRLTPVLGLLAAAGLGCALVAPYTRGYLAGAALFTLGAEYVVAETTGRVPAGSVAAYAAGLIVVSELLLWCVQLPRSGRADRAVAGRQLIMLTATALAAAVLALAALAATGLRLPGAWTGALLGATAAVTLLALPSLLLRAAGEPRAQTNVPSGSRRAAGPSSRQRRRVRRSHPTPPPDLPSAASDHQNPHEGTGRPQRR